MKQEIIIAVKNRDLQLLSFGDKFEAGKGTYRVITKCKAGFMVTSEVEANNAIQAFRHYKPKAIQSIAFLMESGYPITVYARAGKRLLLVISTRTYTTLPYIINTSIRQ